MATSNKLYRLCNRSDELLGRLILDRGYDTVLFEIGDFDMPHVMEKQDAHRLIDQMPQNSTWDDLMHEIYVRESIERGLADSQAGRTRDVKDIRSKYGLSV